MILGFKQKFDDGTPTLFEEKMNVIGLECERTHRGRAYKKYNEDRSKYRPIFLDAFPKIHTIRDDKAGRWEAGRKIDAFYGVRTSNMRRIYTGECKSVQLISIKYQNNGAIREPIIKVDGRTLSIDEMRKLAENDGFDELVYFCNWFKDDYEGKIIHFTDFRY